MQCMKCKNKKEFKMWSSYVSHIINVHADDTDPPSSESEEYRRQRKRKRKNEFIISEADECEASKDEEQPTTSRNKKSKKKAEIKYTVAKPKIKRQKTVVIETSDDDDTDYDEIVEKISKPKEDEKLDVSDSEPEELRKLMLEKAHWFQNMTIKGRGYFTISVAITDLKRKTIIPILEKIYKWEKISFVAKLEAAAPNYMQTQRYIVAGFRYLKKYPNLSFFCCIAYAETKTKFVMKKALEFFQQAYPNMNVKQFDSLKVFDKKELNRLCNLFCKAIYIYAPAKAANGKFRSVYRCTYHGAKVFENEKPDFQEIYLYLFNGRFSYITDISRFRGEYDCEKCNTYYESVRQYNKHCKQVHGKKIFIKNLNQRQGSFRPKLYFKQQLEKKGIPEELLTNTQYKHFLVYDIEAALLNKKADTKFLEENINDGKNSYLLQKHQTVCVALTSTFSPTEIFNLKRFDETGPVDVVRRFVKGAIKLAKRARQLYLKDNEILLNYLHQCKVKFLSEDKANQAKYFDKIIESIYAYACAVPLIGYNSARYDTQVLRYDGLFVILNELDPPIKIIKKGGFMKIKTPHLIWLDAIKYMGVGFSLKRFVKAFAPEIKQSKSFFPYEALNKLERLKCKTFPSYDMFKSVLNGCNTLEEERNEYNAFIENGYSSVEACVEMKLRKPPATGIKNYQNLKKVWFKKKMQTWTDFLNYYVYLDVVPFKKALQNLLTYFHGKNVDIFKAHCSLSSTAVNMLFQSVSYNNKPFLFLDSENYEHIRRTTHGGLVLCSQRYFDCAGGSKIREYRFGEDALPGKIIISFDYNNLYGGIMGIINHLTGPYVQRDLTNKYLIEWCYENFGEKSVNNPGCYSWLTFFRLAYNEIHENQDIHIQSAYNYGEKWILTKDGHRYRVDGYVASQPHNQRPLILEYNGCYYHAHPSGECAGKGFVTHEIHPIRKDGSGKSMTNGAVYEESCEKIKQLEKSGYEVRIMWECAWREQMERNKECRDLIYEHLIPGLANTLDISTEGDMLRAIAEGKIYGLVFASVEVPENLRESVFEFPPICKKIKNFSLEKMSDDCYVKKYCITHELTPAKSFLTSLLSGDDLVLPTEIIRHMLARGYVVKNIVRVLQFGDKDARPFKAFVDGMVTERRRGASCGNTVAANMAKLILNAAVGFTLMKSNLLPDTIICNSKGAKKIRRLRGGGLSTYEFLGPTKAVKKYYGKKKKREEMFLIVAEKKNPPPVSAMPILLGWKVLAMAKLKMLTFMVDAHHYFDEKKWQFLYSDTDSIVCALAEDDIDSCVREEYRREWVDKKRDIFVTNEPGVCDNFTPLRLKVEAYGDKFACISAKMYCIAGVNENIIKSAQKGVKLKLNKNLINFERYKKIIFDRNEPPGNSDFVGFLSSYRDDGFWTVGNEKRSFSGLYFKRKVLDNGYWTQPLDWDEKYKD